MTSRPSFAQIGPPLAEIAKSDLIIGCAGGGGLNGIYRMPMMAEVSSTRGNGHSCLGLRRQPARLFGADVGREADVRGPAPIHALLRQPHRRLRRSHGLLRRPEAMPRKPGRSSDLAPVSRATRAGRAPLNQIARSRPRRRGHSPGVRRARRSTPAACRSPSSRASGSTTPPAS